MTTETTEDAREKAWLAFDDSAHGAYGGFVAGWDAAIDYREARYAEALGMMIAVYDAVNPNIGKGARELAEKALAALKAGANEEVRGA